MLLNIYIYKKSPLMRAPWPSWLKRLSRKQETACSDHNGATFNASLTNILPLTICIYFSFKKYLKFSKRYEIYTQLKVQESLLFFTTKNDTAQHLSLQKKTLNAFAVS